MSNLQATCPCINALMKCRQIKCSCVSGCRIQDPAVHPVREGIPENCSRQGAEVTPARAAVARTGRETVQPKQNFVHTFTNGIIHEASFC